MKILEKILNRSYYFCTNSIFILKRHWKLTQKNFTRH